MKSSARGWTPALVVTVGAGVLLRLTALGRFHGVHGDEAWYGANVQAWMNGAEPFLRTPSGNLLNTLHSVPLLLFSFIFSPSLTVLRLPSAMWGVLTMVLAFPLLRPAIGDRAARWSAMLIAVAPTLIAYSRFGWDPSDIPITTLLALACALRDQPVWSAVCIAVSLLVHPVAIFAVPIYLGAWLPHARRRYTTADAAVRRRAVSVVAIGVAVGAAFAALVLVKAASNDNTWFPSVSLVVDRVTSPASWLRVLGATVELISGGITMTFLAGEMSPIVRMTVAMICAIALLAPIVFAWKRLQAEPPHAIWMFAGALAGVAAMHVLVGPRVAEPGLERYGIALVVPLLITMAIALDQWATEQSLAMALAAVTVATLLCATVGGYVVPFMTQGGHAIEESYRTTVESEPKAAAARFIADDARGASSVRVAAADWTLYWTTRYLLSMDKRISVVPADGVEIFGGEHPKGVAPAVMPPPDRTYDIGWGGGPVDATWRYPREAPILFVNRRR